MPTVQHYVAPTKDTYGCPSIGFSCPYSRSRRHGGWRIDTSGRWRFAFRDKQKEKFYYLWRSNTDHDTKVVAFRDALRVLSDQNSVRLVMEGKMSAHPESNSPTFPERAATSPVWSTVWATKSLAVQVRQLLLDLLVGAVCINNDSLGERA